MSVALAERLSDLARADPAVAPLARLQAEALRATADPAWTRAAPTFALSAANDGSPLLHGQTLRVDPGTAHRLFERLLRAAEPHDVRSVAPVAQAARTKRLEGLAVLAASVVHDAERLAALALAADAEPAALGALGQLLCWPLLQACGEAARPLLAEARWEAGYCPVCAAWPTLAELRGLDGERWLRCARCGAGWRYPHGRCVYCGSMDYRTQGYLAAEAEREARRVVTCDVCQGYLKTLTSFGPLAPPELPFQDMTTLELDVAAIERGYGRPSAPGFALDVSIAGAGDYAGPRWVPWRR